MPWVTVQYTKGQVDAAGQVLANLDSSAEAIDSALDVVNNWRAAHSFPLNTFQTGLRRRAREVYKGALVAQRLKRVSSIEEKLRRFPGMKLSRMQDIGGCRAVVTSVPRVRQLEHAIKSSRMKHVRKDVKDYIREPKVSGYRGIHLIYRYMSDKSTAYNGLLLEMQLRTRLQHAWATAVETVGTFLQEALKSSQGPEEWLQFFAVAGSAFACLEHTPLGPGVSGSPFDITAELRERADKLGVEKTLRAYSQALRVTRDAEVRDLHYFILNLAPPQDLQIIAYTKNRLEEATTEYLRVEKQMAGVPGGQTVLVAADSLQSLRRSYPNYFLDTQVFLFSLARVFRRWRPEKRARISSARLPGI